MGFCKGSETQDKAPFVSLNTFVQICDFDKPISVTQCFVETNDRVINTIPEYFNDNISPCDSNVSLTCNSFICDQSCKSNFTG